MGKKVAVIGSGFAGLSAACHLAKRGFEVTVYEKNDTAGGRARRFTAEGFTFDMGPSWYWMPDVFEKFFNHFDKTNADFYDLVRLDPSYRIFYSKKEILDIPAGLPALFDLFDSIEANSSKHLKKFLDEASYKYEVGMQDLVYKPGRSLLEFMDLRFIKGVFKLHVFQSISAYIRKYFRDPKLIQLLEFPVLFLGAMPGKTPALYSLMNYADMALGTWYPMGGMYKIVEAQLDIARSLNVDIQLGSAVKQILVNGVRAKGLLVNEQKVEADVIVGGADYHHIEQALLPARVRQYTPHYWNKRVMAPSSLIFYLGVNKKLNNLRHHNLFFDEDFAHHAREIYETPKWPEKPLFYVSVTTKTDPSGAPEGMENVFVLVPVATGLPDSEEIREKYYDIVMNRLEMLIGQSVRQHVVYKRSYALKDFVTDYHAFRGNAYGLANTLRQTALLKPSMVNKKINNLYYTGQLTVPGPGVPPSLISGEVVAEVVSKNANR